MNLEMKERDRFELRKRYSELIHIVENQKDNDSGEPYIHNAFEEAEELQGNITHPCEQKTDTELFATFAKVMYKKADAKLKQNKPDNDLVFITERFCSKYEEELKTELSEIDNDITNSFFYKIGADLSRLVTYAEGYTGILGLITNEQTKEQKQRNRISKDQVSELLKVKGENQISDKRITSTEKRIIAIKNAIHSCGENGVPIAELILNCDSFSKTLENLFALSFLVKDRQALMTMDKNLGCIIKKANSNEMGISMDDTENVSHQFICKFDKVIYNSLLKLVKREDCLMHRSEFQIENISDRGNVGGSTNCSAFSLPNSKI